MGQALYRKHRSKSFGEVVGQEHITTALEHALKAGTISHAYLFTGPRGVGKTSVARILAHAVNDLPYSDESIHLDIIEIDAASHRRIDEIRDLRERVHIAPTSAKYKVYIIDEVHMLTREAFNALLKTLEEPPAHVIFILATTEVHKLPETIISRTQHFSFRPIDEATATAHLHELAKAEKIDIDDEALQLIAHHGNGSLRDSISLLDQIRNNSAPIGAAEVLSMLGQAPAELIEGIIVALSQQNASAVMTSLHNLRDQGYEAARIAKQLGEKLRADLTRSDSLIPQTLILSLLAKLIEVPASAEPFIALEICLLETCLEQSPHPNPPAPSTPALVEESPKQAEAIEPEVDKNPKKSAAEAVQTKTKTAKPQATVEADDSLWPQVLEAIKRQHNTLYGIARMATPQLEPDTLTLSFHFAFHQKRLDDQPNRRIIADTIKQLTGKSINVVCVFNPDLPRPELEYESPPVSTGADSAALQSISNIFGGAELLQSE